LKGSEIIRLLMSNLVIVESPTKARTLSRYLGKDYQIEASMGHIRDLPKAELGVDVDKNFHPQYIVPRDKKKRVNELKKVARDAQIIYLASDPDREGEAIAWHLAQIIGHPISDIRRVVFHEITEEAIKEAFKNPRELDMKLVDAQQARRVLDRLVGYKLSPLLWKKVKRGLSAGRVQSVAVRLIVEREREIEAFKSVEYWSIEALLQPKDDKVQFSASLIQLNGKKLEVRKKQEADKHVAALKVADYQIDKITKREVKRTPPPPFTTSTLQQAAGNKLGFTAKKTMSAAQGLYERGFITYMRTDSVNLSSAALNMVRSYIQESFGKNYLPAGARIYKTKSKGAQEAHEAIRPTNIKLISSQLASQGDLTRDQVKLYDLIWKRMVACQMSEAVMDQTTVDVIAKKDDSLYTLRATGSVVKFDGWLKIYGKKESEEEEELKTQVLPELKEKQDLNLIELKPEQHFTEPPPRYNEASLIKKLEELGIGRPSTYAPTLSTIQDRFYVERRERKLFPTPLGMVVTDFLMKNFPEIIDYSFTAHMEDQLDQIAEGQRHWQPTIKDFYIPFEKKLEKTEETAERVQLETETVDKKCSECGKQLVVRFGKFGKFLACSGFPECKHTEAFEEIIDVPCPKCGGGVVVRKTKSGRPFFGCKNYPKCDFASWTKPERETLIH